MKGKVVLVGAGPGDPELITLKALKAIHQADVILYDRLVSEEILKEVPKNAELIYVGKEAPKHTFTQEQICELLVKLAKAGKNVVRLKGGDPFVFGRGGEEVAALIQAGINFEIIPGVTSAIAVPALAGIPLTRRKFASSLAIVTGHEDLTKEIQVNWEKIAAAIDTIVILMGIGNLKNIVERILKGGRNPETPVAIIESGGTPKERITIGKLSNIVKKAEEKKVKAPAIIVMGEVVNLRQDFLKSKPLAGKVVALTRPEKDSAKLAEMVKENGGIPYIVPTLEIAPPENKNKVFEFISDVLNQKYDIAIFTSANGVRWTLEIAKEMNKTKEFTDALNKLTVIAVGPKTEEAAKKFGIKTALVPDEYIAEGILGKLLEFNLKDKRIALPRTPAARETLPIELRKQGAIPIEIPVYESKIPKDKTKIIELINKIVQGRVDIITFTSPLTAQNLFAVAKEINADSK
ncbi:MAG: uroporphyrinogen-III C-methyltransferase, partial [Euryarchaeota archaeon]|nr:uroporphyrinogen-III C-methyltransferase [Euryarchaeota archaeon]